MALVDDLKQVAEELITEFGSTGKLYYEAETPDPISGEGGTESSIDIIYFRQFLTGRELTGAFINQEIADRAKAGDAIAYVPCDQKIKDTWSFEDDTTQRWGIISVKPLEAQGADAVYILHIRK